MHPLQQELEGDILPLFAFVWKDDGGIRPLGLCSIFAERCVANQCR